MAVDGRERRDGGYFTLSPGGLCAVGAISILISVGGVGGGKEDEDDGTFSAVPSRDSVSVRPSVVRHEEGEERGGRLRKVNEEVNATKHGVILRGK